MMCCPNILVSDIAFKDDRVRQDAYDPKSCSFKFTAGQHYLKVRDVVIASCVVIYNETSMDYKSYIPT
jgi:hypothetical protein